MAKSIALIYWFVHNDKFGNIFEDEKGNWIIVFDGMLKLGEPFHVKCVADGSIVDAEKIGLIRLLRSFIVAKPTV